MHENNIMHSEQQNKTLWIGNYEIELTRTSLERQKRISFWEEISQKTEK